MSLLARRETIEFANKKKQKRAIKRQGKTNTITTNAVTWNMKWQQSEEASSVEEEKLHFFYFINMYVSCTYKYVYMYVY